MCEENALGLVHSPLEKFENAALFPRLGILSTLIRHENEAFENGAFQKRWRYENQVISLPEVSSNKNPKWPVISNSAFSNSVDAKHLMRFQISLA